jgi:hypothetical protein
MPTVVQFRRGTTVQNNNFLGANGEISVDTTLHVLRVADGATQGGFALVGQDCVQTITNKTLTSPILTTPTIGVATGTSVSVTGNVTGNYLLGNAYFVTGLSPTQIYSGTSNVTVTGSGANISVGVGGTPNVTVFATTGIYTTGLSSVTGNITGGNISATNHTGTNVSVTGTTTAASVVGGVITGSSTSVTGTTTAASVVGGVITGTSLSVSGNVTGANLTTAGTATIGGFTISGNTIVSSGSTLTIDPNASGGVDGLVIIAGNLQVTGNTTTINSNTVSTNDLTFNFANNAINSAAANGAGIEAGPVGSPFLTFVYNSTSNVWTSNGGLSAVGTITGASVVGGVITGSSASVTGTVTGASVVGGVITGSSASVSGTVTGASHVGSVVSVTGAVTGASVVGGVITGTSTSVTGTVTAASVVGGVITGSSASVTGAVTGASAAFSGASTAASYSATGTVTGASVVGGVMSGTSLTVTTGTITGGNIVNGNGNGVGNIGSSTTYFNTVFAKATSAQYADLAEMYCADAEYAPGTVVEFGGSEEITITTESHSTRTAGIISTNPSYLMNSTLTCTNALEVALVGRVPCQVTGTIKKGDRVVASSTPGVATCLDMAQYQPGCIIGKALEDYNSETVGTIEVAVGRI